MLATRLFVTMVVLLAVVANGWAKDDVEARIPPPLRPWIPWVLDSDEGKSARCPSLAGETERACQWPGRLALDLNRHGGAFKQEWTLFRDGLIDLPGDREHWPQGVRLDGKEASVVDFQNEPKLPMSFGHHIVTGTLVWDSLPESLAVPPETGLVTLLIRGAPVRFPMRENDGRLFLGRKESEAPAVEEDRVDISVYRKLTDAVPLRLTTRLVLAVSGKSRELLLGRALPDGFAPIAVDSRLPVRFESDGRMRVQARPGPWIVDVEAHRVSAERAIVRPVPNGLWKEGDEVWIFEAAPALRTVSIAGAPAIDPAQTLLPELWKAFPAYAMAPGASLQLVEEKRGNSEPAPEKLTLDRVLWLDSNGRAWSVRDRVTGEFTQAWRLEVDDATRLGRLAVNGSDQFLTRMGRNGRVGVEIRGGKAGIEADSRIDNRGGALPLTSFAHDFDRVGATLHLPLAWDLLSASGADDVAGSWVARWSLGNVILLAILVLGLGRLYGVVTAIVALLALAVTLLDPAAPAVVWLFVIGLEVAARRLMPGQPQRAANVLRVAAWVVLALSMIPFALSQASFALHPAGATDRARAPRFSEFLSSMAERRAIKRSSTSEAKTVALEASPPPAETVLGGLVGSGYGMGTVGAGRSDAKLSRRLASVSSVEGLQPQANLRGQAAPAQGLPVRTQPAPAAPALNVADYDPSMVVQTGEGLSMQPAWRTATLAFAGPVKGDRRVRLWLLPPWLCRLMAAASVVLPLLLAWLILRKPLRLRGVSLPSKPMIAGLLALLLLVPLSVRADELPSQEMLDALKKRLLAEPACAPDCVAINDMVVRISPDSMTIVLHISTARPSAVILPGDQASWSPTDVRLDGKPATALARGSDGKLLIAVGSGNFSVELAGPLPARETIQVPLPMRPHHGSVTAKGFEVSGIHEDGAVDESLQLTRIATAGIEPNGKSEPTEAAPTLPPFLRVERTLLLGLKWEAHTRVVRETPTGAPIVVEIPLLSGESVTTPAIRTEKAHGTVSLSFGPTDTEIAWQSTLTEGTAINLRADPANASRWSEVWRAEVGPIWHPTFSGIVPVRPLAGAAGRVPEWHPWPGEEVRIAIERPIAAPGTSKTIDASRLQISPGLRDTRVSLVLEIRTSQSTTHAIVLPSSADDVQVQRDGLEEAVRRADRDLTLTLPTGKHTFSISWRQPAGLSAIFHVPAVDLRMPSVNSSVGVALPESSRWILWLTGPSTGPLVEFWAVLVVLAFTSIVLGRSNFTPLRARDWFLLGLGLSQVNAPPTLVVPLFLLCLGIRARYAPNAERPLLYDLGQIALLVLLVISSFVLVNVADIGLWHTPDMMIAGNDSTATQFHWAEDRVGSLLARPVLLSLPIEVYRLAIVAWFLWLGFSLIGWAGWAWACFKHHGLWRPLSRPLSPPPNP